MKLGLSIEDPALIASTDSKEKEILLAKHDSLEELLTFLKSCGIQSIELRKLIRYADAEEFKGAIQLIWDLGLEITIHGDVLGNRPYNSFLEVYPSMTYILENFSKYQDKLIMPIHACSAKAGEANENELSNQTIEEYSRWIELIEREEIPLYIALENNRAKSHTADPGNSINGVIEMVNKINSPHLGICWDMGHYYSNLLKENNLNKLANETIDDLPSASFLEKVFHTHIHGLHNNGKTHFPLTRKNSLPLENYISALENKGYDGIYNLELSFARWEEHLSVADEIASTIKRLKNASSPSHK